MNATPASALAEAPPVDGGALRGLRNCLPVVALVWGVVLYLIFF